jgi:hypothetical protein
LKDRFQGFGTDATEYPQSHDGHTTLKELHGCQQISCAPEDQLTIAT